MPGSVQVEAAMSDEKTEYLGDGVYADYSTGDLWLYANDAENPTDSICINSDVLTSLLKYVEKSLAVKITVKPKE
jgi:hypothetical protein